MPRKPKIQTEKTINEEIRFRKLIENSYSGITLMNKELKTIYRSPSAERITGWDQAARQQHTVETLTHPEDKEQLKKTLNNVLNSTNIPTTCTFRGLHYEGHYIWLQCTFTNMFHEPDVNAIVCNFLDVTERIDDHHKLAQSERFIKTVTDNLPVMMAYWTADLKCLFANKPYMDWFEKSSEEIIGISKHDLMTDSEFDLYKNYFEGVLQGEPQRFERSFAKANGVTIHTHTQYLPDVDKGRVNGFYSLIYDVTEIKRAETEINKRSEQMQDLLDNMTEGFISLDENLCYTYANKEVEKMTGRTFESLIGKNIWEEFPDAVGSSTYCAIQKAYTERIYVHNEDHYEPLNLWQENRIYPSGRGISMFIRDITKSKREEKHLKLLESVITNTKDAVLITDSDLLDEPGPRIIYVNEAFTKMTGYASEEIIGKTPRVLQGPKSDKDELERLSKAIRKNESCEITTINYKKNGEEFWIYISVNPVIDDTGKCTHFIAVERDVTERKMALREIEQLSERFSLISKATNDAVFELDLEKKGVWWSESHYTMFGFDPLLPHPTREAWLEKIQPESRNVINNIVSDVINNGLNDWTVEIKYYKPDGSKGILLNRGFVMRNQQQQPVRMLGSYIDITQRKNEELQNLLFSDISLIFNSPISLKEILSQVLERLTEFGGFDMAEAWLIATDKKKINLVSRSSNADEMREFFTETDSIKEFSRGEGLPGTTWETQKVQFWNNIDKEKKFLRSSAAKKAGLRSAYGIPLINNGEVIGSLLFGSKTREKADIESPELFDKLSALLSSEIKHKQLEQELNQIFNFAPDVICIASVDGYFKKINPAMSALLEYSEQELLTIGILEFIHPEDLEITINEFDRLKGGASLFYFENRYITKSGKSKWLSWTIAAPNEEGLLFCVAKDITEKKDLEDLLKRANDLARIGGWEVDLIKNSVYWSDITKEILEVKPDFEPDLETGINFYKEGKDRNIITEKLQEMSEDGTPCDVELRVITQAGKTKWIRVIGEAEFSDNKCIRMYGSFQDIDVRKRAELAATAALEEKNTILESIGDAFFAMDKNWTITYWNNMAEKVMGKQRSEMLNKNIWEVYPDAINSKAYEKYEEAKKTNKQVTFELYSLYLNIWLEISVFPTGSGLSVYIKNINDRKKAEHLAIQTLEEKNTILESIGDAFFAVDKNWIITYWNNTAEKLLNISKEKAIDNNLWDIYGDFVNSDSYRKYHEALETDHVVHFENYYKALDKWHEISAYPAANGLSVFFKDVTERKNAEIQLKKLNKTLKKQTKELSISNAELEQFAFVASHDLQEPLRMVTSFLTLLENKYSNVIDGKGKQYIHFAVDGAKRMRQIILDLLEFSKVGNTENELEKIKVDKLVDDILSLYRKQIDEKCAVITYSSLPIIDSYKTPMRQVFQNLISNALKYSRTGIPPVIDITCKESWTNWQFAVSDNGIGIDKEYFDKIFIIFQRLHNKDEYSGTGMGLAVTKKIIENLGGKIWVESEENKGSTFYFTVMKKIES